ncbi:MULTISPECIES: hypothetical protein [unclassified Endozoicomonas]|uniref:hypothetical protein n=1 Tax=unclassified Endozoicomonas TaxID=2644528 RepID=UPI00214876D4|nr:MULTISPECIES: hypothetical protein [unclassified Endozoicomonas]
MNNLNSYGTNGFTVRTHQQPMKSGRQSVVTECFNYDKADRFVKISDTKSEFSKYCYNGPTLIDTSQYRGGNATRALSSYSIKASDDSSENNDNKILQLDIDDSEWVGINENVQAIRLSGCVFLIHVPYNAKSYYAWHLNSLHRKILSDKTTAAVCMSGDTTEVKAAYREARSWREMLSQYPGTSYLCATDDIEDEFRSVFRVSPANITKTGGVEVDITFDIATRSFQVINPLEVEAAVSELESRKEMLQEHPGTSYLYGPKDVGDLAGSPSDIDAAEPKPQDRVNSATQ